MAMDVTVGSLDPVTARSIAESIKSNVKVPEGFASEHILIGDEDSDASDQPATVTKRRILNNWARGVRTELTFFDEGFLKVREYRRKNLSKEYLLELRFLNPKPSVVPRIVVESLWAALLCGAVAAVSWLIAKFTSLDTVFVPATIVGATAAIVLILLFVYQSGQRAIFSTAIGSVPVLKLSANFGCFRKFSSIVPDVSKAVGAAVASSTQEEQPYLRAEMQHHYRLRNEGIITPKACMTGTARILARFG